MAGKSFPIVLTELHDARCLVVGGGPVAERKVAALLECEAGVTVISPALSGQLGRWAAEQRLEHIARTFRSGDVCSIRARPALVIAATGDAAVNAQVAGEARSMGLLVNVVDQPEAGNFHTVATVRRGDLLLTVSTGGASPAMASLVRQKLEQDFGSEYGELLALLGTLRRNTIRRLPPSQRARIWHGLALERMLGWLRAGEPERAEAYAKEQIRQATTKTCDPDEEQRYA